jgi:hypothetical protein
MTGRGLALLAAARRAVAAVPGAAGASIVRDRIREDVPLSHQAAFLLEPLASEPLTWPESQDWRYELSVFTLATVGRARPGSAAHQKLADLHEAGLEALKASAELLDVVSDGPPSKEPGLRALIGGVRWGPTTEEKSRAGDPLSLATTVGLGVWTTEPQDAATLDGAALFAGGPHEVVPGSVVRAVGQRLFNSLRGALLVDLGERPRRLTQAGRLSAASAASLAQLEAAIEARIDGQVHALVGRDGTAYPYVRVERFTRRGPVEVGLLWHRAYEVEYTEFVGA